jgi:hypothetical protein
MHHVGGGMVCWRIALVWLTVVLCGCASLEPVPVVPSGAAFRSVTVVPSLSLPDAGGHPYAWASLAGDEDSRQAGDTGTYGSVWALGGGWLYQQASLRDDWATGYFGAAEGSFELARTLVDYTPDATSSEPPLTAAQSRYFPSRHWGETLVGTVRGGGQSKFFIGTVALYVVGTMRFEQGDYGDFRKKIDGIGRIYNLSDTPLTWGGGLGLDLALGYRGLWAVSGNIEVQRLAAHSQSLVSAQVDDTLNPPDGQWVTRTSPGGKAHGLTVTKLQLSADIQHLRFSVAGTLEASDLFEEEVDFPSNVVWSVAYRW